MILGSGLLAAHSAPGGAGLASWGPVRGEEGPCWDAGGAGPGPVAQAQGRAQPDTRPGGAGGWGPGQPLTELGAEAEAACLGGRRRGGLGPGTERWLSRWRKW